MWLSQLGFGMLGSLSERTPTKRIYIASLHKNCTPRLAFWDAKMAEKRVLVKINKDKTELTLREVLEKIKELQEKNPDMDVFFDGAQYAICGRLRKATEKDTF